jgi:hypothetical protein
MAGLRELEVNELRLSPGGTGMGDSQKDLRASGKET